MWRALQSKDGGGVVTSPSRAELPRLMSLEDGCPSSGLLTNQVNRGRHLPGLTSAADDDIPSPGQTKWKIGFAARGLPSLARCFVVSWIPTTTDQHRPLRDLTNPCDKQWARQPGCSSCMPRAGSYYAGKPPPPFF